VNTHSHPTNKRAHGLANNITITMIFILTHTKFSKSFLQNKFKNTQNKDKQLINSLLKNDYMLLHSIYLLMEGSTLITLYYDFSSIRASPRAFSWNFAWHCSSLAATPRTPSMAPLNCGAP
jgi:hypothetical protein